MRLSIITVVYNGKKTIRQTIESVLGQDYSDTEYIIIDGGSDDGTLDIIREYEDRISAWISEKDKGVYDAMNKGVSMATGEVVAFMNSDDWYEEHAFSAAAHFIKNNHADIYCGRAKRIKNEKEAGYFGAFKEPDNNEMYIKNIYCHQGMFIRRKLFDEIGKYDLTYQICADYDWFLKAFQNGKHFLFMPLDISNVRAGGLSSELQAAEEYREIAYKYSYNNENVLRKIDEQYKMQVDFAAYTELCNSRVNAFEELLPKDIKYYIWGTGDYGDECAKLLNELERDVGGFIDNYPKTHSFHGITIMKPQELVRDQNKIGSFRVIIATSAYEKEIVSQIKEMQLSTDYMTFRYILHWAGLKAPFKKREDQSS